MSEIILGLDMSNSTTASTPTAYYCKIKGRICEYATDFGFCCCTACLKREKEQEK